MTTQHHTIRYHGAQSTGYGEKSADVVHRVDFVVWLNLATTRGTWLGPLFRTGARPEYHSARAQIAHTNGQDRMPPVQPCPTCIPLAGSCVLTRRTLPNMLGVLLTRRVTALRVYFVSNTAGWNSSHVTPLIECQLSFRTCAVHLASTWALLRRHGCMAHPAHGALIPRQVVGPMFTELSCVVYVVVDEPSAAAVEPCAGT